jgi:hypothetical protein
LRQQTLKLPGGSSVDGWDGAEAAPACCKRWQAISGMPLGEAGRGKRFETGNRDESTIKV